MNTQNDRIVNGKKTEFRLMFAGGLAGALACGDAVAQDFYRGALAALEGRPPVSSYFLHQNAQACVRGGFFNEGHALGQQYLFEAIEAQSRYNG